MSDRSEREIPNVVLQHEIETLFQQIFVAGLTLGARLKDMPEKLKRDISAACGDVGKIEDPGGTGGHSDGGIVQETAAGLNPPQPPT